MTNSDQHNEAQAQSLFQQALGQFRQGDMAGAETSLQRTLMLAPRHANALHLAAIIQAQLGRYETAIPLFSRSLTQDPGQANCHSNLGFALYMAGRLDHARAACERAIQLNPSLADAHNMLGVILKDLGCAEEALAACTRAIQLRPDFPEAHHTLSVILKDRGRVEEALASCTRAIQCRPNFAEAHNTLGVILKILGRPEDALAACARATRIKPDFAEAHDNRGSLLADLGRMSEALESCEHALRLNPGLASAQYNHANLLANLGRFEAAEAGYRRVLELAPEHAQAHSNLLFLQAADARLAPGDMLEQQRQWDRTHGQVGRNQPFCTFPPHDATGRRLRIGYISPDFRRHSVAYFFEPLLAAHDRAGFEVFCYANLDELTQSDVVTQRLRQHAEHFRFVRQLDDRSLAQQIYADGIDILIDLAGHTDGNRLMAFTHRPAPIQATYLGYCASSGLGAMDYWITDAVLHPEDSPELASERLYRLPRCSFCYLPPAEAPAVAPRPNANERVVFGSFSHLSKLQPAVVSTWAQLLRQLPGSRLLVMDQYLADPGIRREFTEAFARHGVAPDRLILRGRVPYAQYLATYAEVDIVLDPFPRTGGTTTAEALWMGVPVITLAGSRYVERISASKLTSIGLTDLICRSGSEYIAAALRLARNPDLRQELRAGLRARMQASPLCDGPGLARALEDAYRAMWKELAGIPD